MGLGTPEVDEPIQAHVDAKRGVAPAPAVQPVEAPAQAEVAQPAQRTAAPQQDINPVMPNPIFTQSFDAQPAAKQAPAEEEDDGDYFDDLLSILNKRS